MDVGFKSLHHGGMGMSDYMQFVFALAFVLALMGLCAHLARKAGWGNLPGARGRGQRLAVLEIRPIDARHKMVLVSCDDRQHLVLLGPQAPTVIAANITPPVKEAEPT